jgi:transcriptional regulator with XRE-family HTH domain
MTALEVLMPSVDARALGKRVAQARARRGWDQSELARRAGLSPSYVSRLENAGFTRPSLLKVRAIASALGCRLADLTDPPVDPLDADVLEQVRILCGSNEARFRQILDALAQRPPEERESALEFLLLGLQALAQASPRR